MGVLKKILVIAGSHEEYLRFLYDVREGVDNFKYVEPHYINQLDSVEASHVITIGTAKWSPKYEEILERANARIR